MARLSFGLNCPEVEAAKTAWGARMIMERNGGLDLVYDRQSADGENTKEFVDRLNALQMVHKIREAWRKYYDSMQGYIPQTMDLIWLYDKGGIKAAASTNASHGYVYVAVWEA